MIGKRLKQARNLRGLTQEELASQAGVTKQAISKYELGKDMPGSGVLYRISQALGVSEAFFFRKSIDMPLTKPCYRKEHGLNSRSGKQVDAKVQDWLERYLETEVIFEGMTISHFDIPKGFPGVVSKLEDVEQVAEDLRKRWKIGFDAIDSVTELFEDRGIKVGSADEELGFEALTFQAGRDYVIVVSSLVDGDRQRFSLAHELGHILLNCQKGVNVEKAADRFAAAFLVPREAAIRELGMKRGHLDLNEIHLLKHKYGLSMQGWIRRSRDLGIISQKLAKVLIKKFETNDWIINEPGDKFPKEYPKRMERLVYRAFAEEVISESKARELLLKPIYPDRILQGVSGGKS